MIIMILEFNNLYSIGVIAAMKICAEVNFNQYNLTNKFANFDSGYPAYCILTSASPK